MRIGGILKKWRAMSDLDLRQAGTLMGLGPSTLRRIESGRVPDGETIIKLQAWLFGSDDAPEVAHEEAEVEAEADTADTGN